MVVLVMFDRAAMSVRGMAAGEPTSTDGEEETLLCEPCCYGQLVKNGRRDAGGALGGEGIAAQEICTLGMLLTCMSMPGSM